MTGPKLRITIVSLNYAPEPTGIAPYTTKLAESLVATGHEVQVLTGYPHYPEWKLMAGYTGWSSSDVINGVTVTRLRHHIPQRVTSPGRMLLELSFGVRAILAKWGNPDVVLTVTPSLFTTLFVVLRARLGLRKPPVGVWVQDIYSRGLEELGAGSFTAKLMKRIEAAALSSATRVTVIHERFRDYLSSSLGVSEENMAVIRNWTHVEQNVSVDRSKTRARLGWESNDIVVLHAGNMGAKQGLENVVEAARLADQRGSDVRFVLLGTGNQREKIQGMANDIQHIQFMDPVSDASFGAVLRSADVLLVNEMAGLREMAVPSKLTSYFSTGLPVVAATEADSTTANELELSKGGLRVQPDTPEDLLLASERLGRNKALSAKLGQAGRDYVTARLTQDAAMIQYNNWLRELAATKNNFSTDSNKQAGGLRR